MRAYKEALQQLLKNKLLNFRADHEYSQEHIAELLHISPRALFDLESGKYGFSALTLMFFLSVMKQRTIRRFRGPQVRMTKQGTMQSAPFPAFACLHPLCRLRALRLRRPAMGAEACPRESALRAAPLRNKPVINRE